MLKIWGRANSVNVQKAMWTVGELGLEHERIDVAGKFGGLDTPEFGAMNPNRLVPVLQDGDVTVWESNAVIRYLAAQYGEDSLWCSSPADRALADAWMDWMATTLYPVFIRIFFGLIRTPPARRNPQMIRNAVVNAGKAYQLFDARLEDRDHIVGDTLTMGDIPVGATLYRYFDMKIDRPALPNVERMYAALMERPAYKEHVAISYEDLRAPEA